MARGDKNYKKVVRKVKGKTAKQKISTIHKMVEAIITDDSDTAVDMLSKTIQGKSRRIIMGEGVVNLELDDELDDESDDELDDESDDEFDDESDDESDDEFDDESDDEFDDESDDEFDDESDDEFDDESDDEFDVNSR